tara:strand:- start:270 stop:641 length:372 start_codon:yes stop_codon:yes gene_type:complete
MSNTSYVKTLTSEISRSFSTDSFLVSSNLPNRFYLRGLTVTMGSGTTAINPTNLVFQDGPGQGGANATGFCRVTGGLVNLPSILYSKLIMPEDAYVLIKNGLYYWRDTDITGALPLLITVFYT